MPAFHPLPKTPTIFLLKKICGRFLVLIARLCYLMNENDEVKKLPTIGSSLSLF